MPSIEDLQFTEMTCTPASGGMYECVCPCGFRVTLPYNNGRHACETSRRASGKPLTLVAKAVNFAASSVRHIAAGMPRCTQEQIDARYAICQQCEHFQDGACAKCGCPLVRERQYISKLSWANEECPVGKWGQVTHPAA